MPRFATSGETPSEPTRLEPEFRILRDFSPRPARDDYRHLDPADIIEHFRGSQGTGGSEGRTRLATAIFAGTAQACMRGTLWAPSFNCPGAVQVDCRHLAKASSRLYSADKMPPLDALAGRGGNVRITCHACHPLDVCPSICAQGAESLHIAVVRFSSMRDFRNESFRYGHLREDQLFLRTTYFQSFEKLAADINASIGESLNQEGLIYTPGVGVLRGPIDEGALWFQEPPRADVIWVGLPPRPQLEEQQQYAHEKDRQAMVRVVERIFAWAAAHGVDTLVMPPLGCGTHSCQHPGLDVADIIHLAAHRYARYIHHVCVASDHPAHFEGGWWDAFADAAQNGRPDIIRPMKYKVPPFPLMKKTSEALADKAARATKSTPRTWRNTFL